MEDKEDMMRWEQWGGVLERGRPETLTLLHLDSSLTNTRAPGPGAIKKRDWAPLANRLLRNRRIVLHTDSARSYRGTTVEGMIHDYVIHSKKRIKVNGKWVWLRPRYVKLVSHKLKSGRRLSVKSGTQYIDRCWRFLKESLGSTGAPPGSKVLEWEIRSAQWEYWNHRKDSWKETGNMLLSMAQDVGHQPPQIDVGQQDDSPVAGLDEPAEA